jgi:hypothetical protein
MSENRYMLMILANDDGPHGPTFWAAASLDGKRALTKDQIEALAARLTHGQHFVFPYTEQTEAFGASGPTVQTLAIPPGETIWQYGEPTRTDSLAVLTTVLDGAASPDPNAVVLPVADVVREAMHRFGEADAHDVETHFDQLVLDLDGARTGEPPAYVVRIDRLLLPAL